MTVPLLTQIRPGLAINQYTVQLFLPYLYQFSSLSSPPEPTNKNLELIHYKGNFTVAVRSFDGFGLDVKEELLKLQEILKNENSSDSYDPHRWFYAVYNAPWRIQNRHNEVWLVLNSQATDGERIEKQMWKEVEDD